MKRVKLERKDYEKLKKACAGVAIAAFVCAPLIALIFTAFFKERIHPALLEFSIIPIVCVYALALLPYILYIQLFDRIFEADSSFTDAARGEEC